MSERDYARFAISNPIHKLAPWKLVSGAEQCVTRFLYDSFHPARPDSGMLGYGKVESDGEVHRVTVEPTRYSDGAEITVKAWFHTFKRALAVHYPSVRISLNGDCLLISGTDRQTLDDFLRSSAAIAFRECKYSVNGFDSHNHTNGRFKIDNALDGGITLSANRNHPCRPRLARLDLVHMTRPEDLHAGFARNELDVICIAGDETDILSGRDKRLQDGRIIRSQSNSISTLFARPRGVLADEGLRYAVAAAIPREEFGASHLKDSGRAACGFTEPTRSRDSVILRGQGKARTGTEITFIVPPSERTVGRGRWIADWIAKRTGLNMRVVVPSWQNYWRAVHNPAGGDLLWGGISVEEDQARYWVRYNLFGSWLPIPEYYESLRRLVWAAQATDADLVAAERDLVEEGWVMPLYHHYQTYLVRRGLRGLHVDPADWPIPGIHYADQLTWD